MKPERFDAEVEKPTWWSPVRWLEEYSLWTFKRPVKVFVFWVVFLLILFAAALGSGSFSFSEDAGEEWWIKDDTVTKRHKAIDEALDDFGRQNPQLERSEDAGNLKLWFVYTAEDSSENIFTEDNLNTIREIENEVLGRNNYTDFCQVDYSSAITVDITGDASDFPCVVQASPLQFFFQLDENNLTYTENLIDTVEGGLSRLRGENDENLPFTGFYITKDFITTGKSVYTRSRYNFGLPVKGFRNRNEDEDDQQDFVMDNFLEDLEDDYIDKFGMDERIFRTVYMDTAKFRNLDIKFRSTPYEQDESNRAAIWDFTWAILSIFAVWVYMVFHLGSFFLSIVGMFEVAMAIPAATFFYRMICQIDYFDFLNLLVVFVLLGIGADDIFVFTDAFKQSHCVSGVGINLKNRLVYTTERASKAVFVTSFTTMAAFFATAVSSLMPIQAFGIFAGICVIFLFMINVLIMPAALVLWAGYTPWAVKHCCCCCQSFVGMIRERFGFCTCCHITEDEGFDPKTGNPRSMKYRDQPVVAAPGIGSTDLLNPQNQGAGRTASGEDGISDVRGKQKSSEDDVSKMRPLEKFFNGPYFNFLQYARFPIIVVGLVIFAVGLYLVTTFNTPDEAEEWFPPEHMYNKFDDIMDRDGPFYADDKDAFARVHLVWGLKGMDQSDINRWDGEDFGKLEYDETFDMTSVDAQRFMRSVCDIAREEPCIATECRGDTLVNQDSQEVECWIIAMDEWLQANMSTRANNTFRQIPLEQDEFLPTLKEYMETDAAQANYQEHVGLFETDGVLDLKFAQFILESTYLPPTSRAKGEFVMETWENFMVKLNAMAIEENAVGVSNGYQSGRVSWTWIKTQKAFIQSAISGVFTVFAIALVVLNIATGNVVISALAIFTVASVVTTVLGICIRGMRDWDLGIAESLISIILVGFSMDYTLHLSDAYIESHHHDRMSRTRDALTHLGISVTAGALTTLLAGVFLWGAILTFFTKFAFDIMATIISSYLFSILFFPALTMTIGPEGEFGNWSALCRCARNWYPVMKTGTVKKGDKTTSHEVSLSSAATGNQDHGAVAT